MESQRWSRQGKSFSSAHKNVESSSCKGLLKSLYLFVCLQNPYVLSVDPCGSSSGSAISVAANMVAVSLGTETDGSILCPSGANSVVGIKPTVGLTSRAGIIPVTPRQDTTGCVTRKQSARRLKRTYLMILFGLMKCSLLVLEVVGRLLGRFRMLFMFSTPLLGLTTMMLQHKGHPNTFLKVDMLSILNLMDSEVRELAL